MRLILSALLYMLLAISCTRTNSPSPKPTPRPGPTPDPPPTTLSLPLLDSFKVYTLGPKEIILGIGKMNYDGAGRLKDIYQTGTDTTLQGQPLRPDTLDFTLIYQGSDSLPYAYTDYVASLAPFLTGHG